MYILVETVSKEPLYKYVYKICLKQQRQQQYVGPIGLIGKRKMSVRLARSGKAICAGQPMECDSPIGKHNLTGTRYPVQGLGIWYHVSGTWHQVPVTWFQAPGTRHMVPGTSYQLLGTR